MALFTPVTELFIDGSWVDVSDDVQYETGVAITRGRDDEQGTITPSRLNLTLNNQDGIYSNRNPMSPYYGLLGRNTPLRQRQGGIVSHLRINGDSGGNASAPDTAALDIVGDIDVRADIEPDTWTPTLDQVIASKTNLTGDQRSWYMQLTRYGRIEFGWSAAGTFPYERVSSTASVTTAGRVSVRATLDVVSGANHVITFYTSDSVTGTWTQLGLPITTAGATSIFAGTANLEVGTGNNGSTVFTGTTAFQGKVYRLQVLQGIAGTVRADADFSAQPIDTTSFSDGTNTWTVLDPAVITSDGVRFYGEVAALPSKWDLSGKVVWAPLEAAGITRRLTQGAPTLRSPIYRNFLRYGPSGYWPLEDGSESETAASAVPAGRPATVNAVTFAGDDTLPGGDVALTLNDTTARVNGQVTQSTGGTGWSFTFFFKLPAIPGASNQLMSFSSSGTAQRWVLSVTSTSYQLDAYDVNGTSLITSVTTFGTGAEPNQWVAVQVATSVSGATVTWSHVWHAVGADIIYSATGTYAGTPGSVRGWSIVGQSALVGAAFAHVWAGPNALPFVTTEFEAVSNGWRGERAVARLTRLCAEENVPLVVRDPNGDSALMGRQGIGTFIDLLADCATADLGILYEPRDRLAIGYVARSALYGQPSPTLSYGTHIAEPFDPVDDDQQLQNRVTVSRPGGSSATAQQDTGPLSVLPPPAGVGVYEASADANVYTDDQLPDVAGWLVHLGTLDALRYPQITLKLNSTAFTGSTAVTAAAAGLDIGRQLTVDSLPSWLPPDPAETLIQGYTERITPYDWDLTFNTTPGELWDVAHADSARVDTDGSTLAAGATTTATSLSVASVAGGVLWTLTAASWPFSIAMGGEKLTVTAVAGATSPQTLTVTRSVNGVVKAHLAGTAIRLWTPSYVAL